MKHESWRYGVAVLTAEEVEAQVMRWMTIGHGNTRAASRMLAGTIVRRAVQITDGAIFRMMGK